MPDAGLRLNEHPYHYVAGGFARIGQKETKKNAWAPAAVATRTQRVRVSGYGYRVRGIESGVSGHG